MVINRLKGFEKWAAHSTKFFWEYSPRTDLIPYVWHICSGKSHQLTVENSQYYYVPTGRITGSVDENADCSLKLSLFVLLGTVDLHNLPLKKTALKGLELPLEVKSGFIGHLQLSIPLRRPKSEPWIVHIKKLYLVAGPLQHSEVIMLHVLTNNMCINYCCQWHLWQVYMYMCM